MAPQAIVQIQQIGYGRRARQGEDRHPGARTLDALGQLHFALTGQQGNRAHLAQVHAYRVRTAAALLVGRGLRHRSAGGDAPRSRRIGVRCGLHRDALHRKPRSPTLKIPGIDQMRSEGGPNFGRGQSALGLAAGQEGLASLFEFGCGSLSWHGRSRLLLTVRTWRTRTAPRLAGETSGRDGSMATRAARIGPAMEMGTDGISQRLCGGNGARCPDWAARRPSEPRCRRTARSDYEPVSARMGGIPAPSPSAARHTRLRPSFFAR